MYQYGSCSGLSQCLTGSSNRHPELGVASRRGTAVSQANPTIRRQLVNRAAYGTLFESSNVSLTLAVFPGSTLIGSGVGGLLPYIPREEPDGGEDWASHFPVGS